MENSAASPPRLSAVDEFLAGNPQPGALITEAWKLEHFGIKKPISVEDVSRYQLELLSAFSVFSTTLLVEHQIYLKAAGKGAHVVVSPSEQTEDAMGKRTREMGRSINSLRVELLNVNVGALTQEQRKENSDAQVKAAMIATMFRKAKRLRLPRIEPTL